MSKTPNIIFYFTDQQRADTLTPDVMPYLWQEAQENALYDFAYTCQPVCGPARACLQTGLNASCNRSVVNNIPLQSGIKTLASYLNENGYDTAYIGKWHLASGNLNGENLNCQSKAIPKERLGDYRYFRGADVLEFTSHGYDGYIFDEDGNKLDWTGYRVDAINDFAIEYLKTRPTDKPFFMFVSQLEPHHQNDRHCFEGYKPTISQFENATIPQDLQAFTGNYKKEYPNYLSAINRIDFNFEKLVNELKSQGIFEDTVIFFTADHGNHFKTRNVEYKRSPHDASLHIPLVAINGDFKNLGRQTRLVSLLDMPSTILDVAKIPIPASFQGISLLRAEERDCVYVEISESYFGRAIRTKQYTYSIKAVLAHPFAKKARLYKDYCLYDNIADPCQAHNLIHTRSYKQVKDKLRQILTNEMEAIGQKHPIIL